MMSGLPASMGALIRKYASSRFSLYVASMLKSVFWPMGTSNAT